MVVDHQKEEEYKIIYLIADRQKEMTLMQKAMLAEHKKLTRGQRTVTDKAAPQSKGATESAEATVSDEVELEALAVSEE